MNTYGPKRVTGFMKEAKRILTRLSPEALPAREVVEKVRWHLGELPSASSHPEGSLIATLTKHHQDYGIERRRDWAGRYVYYCRGPDQAPATPPVQAPPNNGDYDGGCCITPSSDAARKIQALVDLGRYATEHDAHRDLVNQGLEAVLAKLSR